ncbi:MAG: hypothetical protein KAI47_13175, partial [Deltaproteobacteria bacterium]|nr:hypothetical protein [Deltaproteobacteria bacterium]
LRYDGIQITSDAQKTMVTASLTVFDGAKPLAVMRPARWFFATRPDEPTSEVSIRRALDQDLFVALGRYSEGGAQAGIKVVLNPLVNFVWIGFLVLTLGTFIAGIPVSAPQRVPARSPSDDRTGRRRREDADVGGGESTGSHEEDDA